MDDGLEMIGVIGAGAMGAGILQRLVERGLPAVAYARRPEALERLRAGIEKAAALSVRLKRAEKESAEAGLAALRVTGRIEDLAAAVLVIEAIAEDFHAKVALFRALAPAAPLATVATNTSSLSIARLARESGLGERLCGLHFMNPVPSSRLVELVRHEGSGPAHLGRARALAARLGLEAVELEDAPGFVVNRLLMPMIAEAARLLDEGVADAEAVDAALRLGAGHPMGPLALADLIGLDVVLQELEELDHALGPRFAPPELLRQLVADGCLGRKTGRGFHRYGR